MGYPGKVETRVEITENVPLKVPNKVTMTVKDQKRVKHNFRWVIICQASLTSEFKHKLNMEHRMICIILP